LLDAHEEGAAEVQLKETLASKEALVAELEDAGATKISTATLEFHAQILRRSLFRHF
jgi:hypothetical protein